MLWKVIIPGRGGYYVMTDELSLDFIGRLNEHFLDLDDAIIAALTKNDESYDR